MKQLRHSSDNPAMDITSEQNNASCSGQIPANASQDDSMFGSLDKYFMERSAMLDYTNARIQSGATCAKQAG